MMPGEDRVGQIIEAFPASSTLIALPGRLFLIEASSYDLLGITKRTLSSFQPAKLSNTVAALAGVYQVLYIYLHLLDSLREVGKVTFTFYHVTTPESNMSLIFYPCGNYVAYSMQCGE
jgi:hypothetical protein